MFGFGRQKVSTYDATLESAAGAGSTAIGTSRFWPDACSVASQIALWIGEPVQRVTVVAIEVVLRRPNERRRVHHRAACR